MLLRRWQPNNPEKARRWFAAAGMISLSVGIILNRIGAGIMGRWIGVELGDFTQGFFTGCSLVLLGFSVVLNCRVLAERRKVS